MEQKRLPARLADDAAAMRERVGAEAGSADRGDWLDRQLIALETQARALAGDSLTYLDHVERCFDLRPTSRPDDEFRALADRLDALVPGSGPLQARLAELDEALTIPVDRLPAVAHGLIDRFRSRAAEHFGLPEGERLRLGLVRNQPWSGYNWYEGGLVSRVDVNTDLPMRAPDLSHVLAHETYPGHHLEHAWKEADLVVAEGRLEASILLINTPECLISEGLADVGTRFATPPEERAAELGWVIEAAGLAPPRRSGGRRRDRGGPAGSGRGGRERGADAARRGPLPRRGSGLPGRCRAGDAGTRREAALVHRAPALAHLCLRVLGGRGAARALARCGRFQRSGRRGSRGCCTSS